MADENTTLNDSGASSYPGNTDGDLVETVIPTPAQDESSGDEKSVAAGGTETPNKGGPGGVREEESLAGDEAGDQKVADEKGEKTAAEKDAKGDEKSEKGKDKDPPFHEHERWKELQKDLKSKDTLIARLEGKIDLLSKGEGKDSGDKSTEESRPDFENLADLDRDAILEWQAEDPAGFLGNFARQLRAEMKEEIRSEVLTEISDKELDQSIEKTFSTYADENPGFTEMWNDGTLKAFIDRNPGHNAISAHLAITKENSAKTWEEKLEEARNQALEEGEKKAIEKIKVKEHARSLEGGPAVTSRGKPDGVSADLKNTKLHGGTTAVLAKRMAERRKARAAQPA